MLCMDSNMHVYGPTEDAQQDLSQNDHLKLVAPRRSVFDHKWYAELRRELKLQWRNRLLCIMPKC